MFWIKIICITNSKQVVLVYVTNTRLVVNKLITHHVGTADSNLASIWSLKCCKTE
jgi:hypothetical protein